jgi:FdrA protein
MQLRTLVRRNCYQDSVKLMQLTRTVRDTPGVTRAAAIMGTENNRATLVRGGFAPMLLESAGPNDLLLIVEGQDDAVVEAALARYESLVDADAGGGGAEQHGARSLASAVTELPGANLALISVPGEYAAYEAFKALRAGLNVQVFSDNVSVEDEVNLKRLGRELGRLVMGPDCGTSLIGGAPIGFANVVASGPIGIVGASGTGIQELSVLVDLLGSGVSHAIGLGGRDLSDEVGGISATMALDAFAADENTRVVILTAKPPGPKTGRAIVERLRSYPKPIVLAFLGGDRQLTDGVTHLAANLEQAARMAVELAGPHTAPSDTLEFDTDKAAGELGLSPAMGPGARRFVRGLYTGGGLAHEALLVLADGLGPVGSNISPVRELKIAGTGMPRGHAVIDMGDDEFTVGRPHPMIDPDARAERLIAEWADPTVAVILCDLVLGYGSHPNPAKPLADAVRTARLTHGEGVTVVASVCGTEKDPQRRSVQRKLLRDAGILVAPTNAAAARAACDVASRHFGRCEP